MSKTIKKKFVTSIKINLTPKQKKELKPLADKLITENVKNKVGAGTMFIGQPQTNGFLLFGFHTLEIGILPCKHFERIKKIMKDNLVKFKLK